MVQRLAQLISNPRRAGRSERRERPDCTCDRRRHGWAQYLRNYIANPYLPPAPPQSPGTFSDPFGTSFDSPPKLFESKGGTPRESEHQSLRSERCCRPIWPLQQPLTARRGVSYECMGRKAGAGEITPV